VDHMKTSFQQTCSVNAVNDAEIRIQNVDGNVTVNNVNWDQTINVIVKCVQSSAASSEDYQKLAALIGELPPTPPTPPPAQPSPVIKNLKLWGWVVVPLVVFLVLWWFGVKVGWNFFIILTGFTMLTLGLGKFWDSWPYDDVPDSTLSDNNLMIIFLSAGVLLFVMALIISKKSKKQT